MWKWAWIASAIVAGCGGQGDVTFFVAAPSGSPDLSPLDDARRDSIFITATDSSGASMPYGAAISALGGGQSAIGAVPVGTFDIRLTVIGGGEMLGIARSRQVTIGSGSNQLVTVDVRKPLAFYGSSKTFPKVGALKFPTPTDLMALDTTLPGDQPELAPVVSFTSFAQATASTSDGRFLLAGTGGNLNVIDTLSDGLTFNTAQSTALPNSSSVASITISPDDQTAAVVTDQGVQMVSLARDANGVPIPSVLGQLANPGNGAPPARAAAFAPDSQTVTALASQPWPMVVDNCVQPPASSLSTFTVGTVDQAQWRPTSKGATGVAYDASGTLLVTLPCSASSVVHEADGSPAVPNAAGVIAVVVDGDRFAGVEGPVTSVPVDIDPNNPLATNPTLSFGQFFLQNSTGISRFQLPVPDEPLSFVWAVEIQDPFGGLTTQYYSADINLVPARVDAYSLALSPDGTHLVFASRVRFVANQLNFYVDSTDSRRHCDVTYSNEIYRITEVDLNSGQRLYESLKGITDNNQPCNYYCCLDLDPSNCQAENVRSACLAFSDQTPPPNFPQSTGGFVPAGVSVLLGAK